MRTSVNLSKENVAFLKDTNSNISQTIDFILTMWRKRIESKEKNITTRIVDDLEKYLIATLLKEGLIKL